MTERTVHESETNAVAVAKNALADPLKAAVAVLNLAGKLQPDEGTDERLSGAQFVRLLLLQRLQNDLRCCAILVERGCPMQAAALAAGIFEGWETLANIRTDLEALKWLSHEEETATFGRIQWLTRQALKNIAADAKEAGMSLSETAEADKWFAQYQQLCMPKYLNPILERGRGYTLDGTSAQFRPGPETSELAIKQGWFALERASRFMNLALFTVVHDQDVSAELRLELAAQQVSLDALQDESVRRWPHNS